MIYHCCLINRTTKSLSRSSPRCSYAYFIPFLSRCKRFVPAISDNTRPGGKRQQPRMQRKPGQNRSWRVPQRALQFTRPWQLPARYSQFRSIRAAGPVEIPSILEKGRKKGRERERGCRETVGGLLSNGSPHSPLTLRAAIDCLSVHADDEKTSRNSLARWSNGAIEDTFPGIVDYFHPDRIY